MLTLGKITFPSCLSTMSTHKGQG